MKKGKEYFNEFINLKSKELIEQWVLNMIADLRQNNINNNLNTMIYFLISQIKFKIENNKLKKNEKMSYCVL